MGRQLHELLGWPGPLTHRQYVAWQEWLGEEWNIPDRGDSYLMQLAMQLHLIRHMFSKNQPKVGISDFKVTFGKVAQSPSKSVIGPMTKELATKIAKATWAVRLGRPIE